MSMIPGIEVVKRKVAEIMRGRVTVREATPADLPSAKKHAGEIAECGDGTFHVSDGTTWVQNVIRAQ